MITTAQALDHLLALVAPGMSEAVPLAQASGRVLAEDVVARRDQPPFAASAMDGYAIAEDAPQIAQRFEVIGEAAAGHVFDHPISGTQAVRIFTGAPLPEGARRVVIQEDVARQGDTITIQDAPGPQTHIRPAAGDFRIGDKITAKRRLSPADIALAASMNHAELSVFARPKIALISTGDELVMPGDTPRADQIISSNSFGLKARLEQAGAEVRLLPIARDTPEALSLCFDLAQGADLIVTIGGASVGDHDIVSAVAENLGLERSFYKVAMRPGKPLMAGRIGPAAMVGLPGNPVSSMVCAEIFLIPMIEKMLGLAAQPRIRMTRKLAAPLTPNGPREHYMRAAFDPIVGDVRVFERQDSSLLSILAQANCLVVRPPDDPARETGDLVEIIEI